MIDVQANEPLAQYRRVFFDLRGADGITPANGEDGGQPQVSTNVSPVWTNVGIGTLHFVGNGRYYADLDPTVVTVVGTVFETRYKSGNTAETPGDSAQIIPALTGSVT